MDNQGYYIRNGALSYELDQEHTDNCLTDLEMRQISGSLHGMRNAVHLCCGAGRHVAAFEELGIPSIGIDISPELLKMGKERIRQQLFVRSPCLVLADAALIPIKDHSVECVTLLGNSLCLFPKDQCVLILAEIDRILASKGLFIVDLPDPEYLNTFGTRAKETTQIIATNTLGEIQWTWIRQADPGRRLLVSQEFVRLPEDAGQEQTKNLRFEFYLYAPEQACSMSEAYGMNPERIFECEDASGRYKGMLRKRVFVLLRARKKPHYPA